MAPGKTYTGPFPTDLGMSGHLDGGEAVDDGNSVEPIAIVGLSLKFPQDATSPEAFWDMILEKRCAMTEIPSDRMNVDAFQGTDPSRNDTITPRGGHFIKEDITLFDAPFFSITSAEAASMDVQQRQLLECVYRALENAGMPIENMNGSRTSVHTGSFSDDYRLMTMRDHECMPTHAATGSSISILANRISWFYNLHGPSLQIDTACSSSLVALDMACQGLRTGGSDMGIVAGSNVLFNMDTYLILSNMNFLSPDSRCYSFDHRGNGYARGEGFGVLVLKRLADAVRDGDAIRAVIRASGSNSDGRTPGIAQPSGDAQEALTRETYAKAGLSLDTTRFFEAHGTGTAVGDPIEARAMGAVFSRHRSPDEPLYVGAVKSNVGHLEGTSGVAGVIKAVLALEKGVIPPNTNFEQLNPSIDAASLNLRFPTEAVPWPSRGLRRASVNSFGFGGSNAHIVLDDAHNFLKAKRLAGFHNTVKIPPTREQIAKALSGQQNSHPNGEYRTPQDEEASGPALLVWSAADEGGVKRLADAYNNYSHSLALEAEKRRTYLSDLAYTLARRRSTFPWRSYAISNSAASFTEEDVSLSKATRCSRNLGLGYIFTGQGAQFAGMGRDLLAYPVFRATLQRAQLYLYELGCKWSLMEELLLDKATSRVNRPDMSQPLCTALQIALVMLLQSWNITPKAVVGHSSGEIVAAYCVGGLSLRSACKVAFLRGKLAAELATSSPRACTMMAVGLSEMQAAEYIKCVTQQFPNEKCGIVVACINSATSVTISGDANQIEALRVLLLQDSIFARRLQVDVGYHSPQMEQIAAQYLRELDQLELGVPLPGCTTMISSVTNAPIKSLEELSHASYWVKNLVSPVRFSDALASLVSMGAKSGRKKLGGVKTAAVKDAIAVYDFLEIGPHGALGGPVREILKTSPRGNEVSYASCLTRNVPAVGTTLAAAGRLWCLGYPVDVSVANHFQPGKLRPRMPLTDLPEYPFDHSQSYWHESRVSKEYRLRKHARRDLLGTRSVDWNPLEARWRKFIRISETPWVDDHVVNGSTIYPAAGMLVMAIEGVQQLAEDASSAMTRSIKGYRVTEATFQRALGIDSTTDKGTETQLYMRPIQDAAAGKEASRFEFRICTVEGNQWSENCRGQILIEYEETEPNDVDGGLEIRAADEAMCALLDARSKACTQTADIPAVYDHFHKMGLKFGPSFQTLERVHFNNDGQVVANVKTFEWEATDGKTNPRQPHLIHPTTLDAFIQVILAGLTRGATRKIPTTVPTRVTDLWLSNTGLSYPDVTGLRATSCQLSRGARQTQSSLAAFGPDNQLRASIAVLETTNIDAQNSAGDSENESRQRRLCYHMDWKPDFDCLSSSQGPEYFGAAKAVNPVTALFYQDLACFLYSTIVRTLQQLDPSRIDPSRVQYIEWMKLQVQRFNKNQLLHQQPDWAARVADVRHQEVISRRLESFSTEGRFYVQVARQLLPILQGEADALQLLFSGDLVKEYYLEINSRLSDAFARVVDLLAHKNPGLKALEIGAGTGGTTAHILKPLFNMDGGDDEHGNNNNNAMRSPRCARYDFTDVSLSFFEQAQRDFAAYAPRMRYAVLDIEQDPAAQGFADEAGTYDLVVAANVLHATRNLDTTLRHVHALLRPGGRLVLLEQTGDFARGGFAFGLMPGWWLSEDGYRWWGPTMSPEKWDGVLIANGFSGTDLVLSDYGDEKCQELSIIVSTAQKADRNKAARAPHISLVTTREAPKAEQLARQLQQLIAVQYGVTSDISYLEEESSLPSGACCVFLVELDAPLLHSIDEQTFKRLQATLLSAQGLVWVTGGGGDKWSAPEFHVADGLLRGLRTENAMLKAATLAIDPDRQTTDVAEVVLQVLDKVLSCAVDDLEVEYRDQEGLLLTNRVVEADHMNEHIHNTVQPLRSRVEPFGEPNLPPLALQFQTPGLLDSLRFVEDEAARRPLRPNEVEIEVMAVGVNFMDLLTALGRINQVEIGGECAGIVSRVGSNAAVADLRPGDRVCAVAFDCFKTYARADERTVVKIPCDLSFTDAAALPVTYTTAHYALVVAGRLRKGDRVLIHAAAGGTGQSALQLAQHLGAEVFATVGSLGKKRLLMDRYGIPEDHIFYSRDTSFAKGIMRMTSNRGVDVVLNSLAGDGLAASWACMASFGRFIEIGKKDIHAHSRLDMFYFAKNVSFTAVDVFGMTKERPALVRESLSAAIELVAAGLAKASHPVQTYSVSEIETALRYMQSGKSAGKLVIEMKKEDKVLTVLKRDCRYSFNCNATYVIAGGFGGIARRTARWMADRGARHLLLLSRSGPKSDAAKELIQDLRSKGVQVQHPLCDVASEQSVAAALAECAMPPVRGCIQGAMVLRDAMFDKMTHTEWTAALQPKVDGSRALDRCLPSGLDFFIMLSSVVGIHGSAGQSNYAAGGTFQDALARHRVARGERAVVLDLGWMVDDGIIAESDFLTRTFEAAGLMMPLSSDEYLALLEYYCSPDVRDAQDARACQVMIGLESPAALVAKGADVPALLQRSTFRYMNAMALDNGGSGSVDETSLNDGQKTARNWSLSFKEARSSADAGDIVVDALTHKLSRALSIPPGDIDTMRPLHSYGVDSLLAVELRNWLAKEFTADVAVFEIIGAANFGVLGATVLAKSQSRQVDQGTA